MIKEISVFSKPVTNVVPRGTLTIEEVADLIANDPALKRTTQALRAAKTTTEHDAIKNKRFDYVTFGGTFSRRKDEALLKRSGYICADLDHIGDNGAVDQAREKIMQGPEPVLMFRSPSGDGLKVVYSTDPAQGSHDEYKAAITRHLNQWFPLKGKDDPWGVDLNALDLSRATYLAHDPEVYLSKSETVLGREFLKTYPDKDIKVTPIDRDPLKYGNVTELTEEKPAPRERNPMPSKGPAPATMDPERAYEVNQDWLLRKGLTFTPGSRNAYITALAGALHRFGVDEGFTRGKLLPFAQDDFTTAEIEASIKSVYSNPSWDGKALDEPRTQQAAPRQTAAQPTQAPREDLPFIRVGTEIYKIIKKVNAWGVEEVQLKRWTMQVFLIDYSKKELQNLPQYDDFCMVPSNTNYQPVVKGCYNLYNPFPWTPAPGPWIWTERLMEHVFGDQLTLGYRYMKMLYEHPERSTVILALVSTERETGKTTFLDFLDIVFGANCARLSNGDMSGDFNSMYATKNILTIDETLLEKQITNEKLKTLATARIISINEKKVAQFKVPFYGKIVLASNHERRFTRIDPDEVRFFIRKLGKPKYINHNIREELHKEVPAFLHHLASLPAIDWTVSRSGFTRDELINKSLVDVIEESRSGLYKDLKMELIELFENSNHIEIYGTAKDIKDKFFPYDKMISLSYLRRVLREEFELTAVDPPLRYDVLGDKTGAKKMGRAYKFERFDFTTLKADNEPF